MESLFNKFLEQNLALPNSLLLVNRPNSTLEGSQNLCATIGFHSVLVIIPMIQNLAHIYFRFAQAWSHFSVHTRYKSDIL